MQTLHCESCFYLFCSQGDVTRCSEVTVNGAKAANSKSTEKEFIFWFLFLKLLDVFDSETARTYSPHHQRPCVVTGLDRQREGRRAKLSTDNNKSTDPAEVLSPTQMAQLNAFGTALSDSCYSRHEAGDVGPVRVWRASQTQAC